jgi:threonine dehydratase
MTDDLLRDAGITRDGLASATAFVTSWLRPTPLVHAPRLGAHVFLKLESFQPTGSFKVRGAFAALGRLPAGEHAVTVSAGNHALGVAYAAEKLGLDATVFLPEGASEAKLQALSAYPATVVCRGRTYEEAREYAFEEVALGRRYVSPFNDPDVVAGQATLGDEILAQLGEAATIVCPMGGGGLASGLALSRLHRPDVQIVGVEAAASQTIRAALEAGHEVPVERGPTIADGITGNLEPQSITIPIIRSLVDSVVAVEEDEIAEAIRVLSRDYGIVVEGAGAVPLAALLAGRVKQATSRLVLVLSGRNISASLLAQILDGGPAS